MLIIIGAVRGVLAALTAINKTNTATSGVLILNIMQTEIIPKMKKSMNAKSFTKNILLLNILLNHAKIIPESAPIITKNESIVAEISDEYPKKSFKNFTPKTVIIT